MKGESSQGSKGVLFFTTTLMGSLCWVLTKILVDQVEEHFSHGDGTSSNIVLRVAVFTTWATSLGASLSVVISEIPSSDQPKPRSISGEGSGGAAAAPVTAESQPQYTYMRLLADALPFVVLFDAYCVFQGAALIFLSVSVVTTDSYAAMVLVTAALTVALLGTPLGANEAAGLGFIGLSLALVGVLQEALGVDDGGAAASGGKTTVAGATLGLAFSIAAGCCYATTNVTMQRYLQRSPVDPITLTAAYSLLALASTTALAYPALWLCGAAPTATEWWPALRAAPVTFSAFVAAKMVWYNMEAVLVQVGGSWWLVPESWWR